MLLLLCFPGLAVVQRNKKCFIHPLLLLPSLLTADQSRAEPTGLTFCSLERVNKNWVRALAHAALVSLQPACPRALWCWMKSHLNPISFISSVFRMTGRGCVGVHLILSFLPSVALPQALRTCPSIFHLQHSVLPSKGALKHLVVSSLPKGNPGPAVQEGKLLAGWYHSCFTTPLCLNFYPMQLFQGKLSLQSDPETRLKGSLVC